MAGVLGDAAATLSAALSDLARSRQAAASWRDDQRRALDRGRLDPLEQDGQRLLTALQRAHDQISAAERQLSR